MTDSAKKFPGRDLRYFAEILRDIGGPLLARTLQPAADLPTAEELTNVWLNHLTIDSLIHYRAEFTTFAGHFLERLAFHLENQQAMQWIAQALRQRSSEAAMRRMADAAAESATNIELLHQEVARLTATLATVLQAGSGSTVTTGGGAYNAGNVSAQNFAGRDLTINNYIVDGLVHVASYNPGRRIRKFLNEYLGSAENPVAFGGRQAQLDELNGWIDDPTAQPYYLLAAEAGRGKSALVCRWMAQLLQRDDVEVVFIPISIRFEMASQKEVFEALAARLAKVHQAAHRSEATRAVLSPEQWRTVCESYLDRPVPAGKQLVVILDGLDEATDWQIGAGFFSDEPPPGLRVLVTARLRASETTPQAWAATLGWLARLARLQTLPPLSRSGVEEALVSMGNPLDKLPNQQAVTDQLYRLSEEGDPLLVKLYVDALFAKGAQAAFLHAEELAQLKPGLHEYFEQWWKGQKAQWQVEGRNPLRTEQSVLHLLNLLSAALGPLKKADLGELVPERFTDGILIDEWLTDINRWVTGDGVEQGYTFSHPRFGYYFWEKMLPRQQEELDKRFTEWGELVLRELNAGKLTPKRAPEYLLRNYASHLERSNAPAEAFYALISNGWRLAWEVVDVSYGGFLRDVERAWERARQIFDDNRLGRTGALVQQMRSALCKSSVATLNRNMPPDLLAQLVASGLRAPVQALATLRLIVDEQKQSQMIVALAPYLSAELLEETLIIARAFKDEFARAAALGALVPNLTENNQTEIIKEVLIASHVIHSESSLANVLTALAPHLSAHLIEETLAIAYAIRSDYDRATTLIAFIPHMPTDFLWKTLAVVRMIEDEQHRIVLLGKLAQYLPAVERVKILEESLTSARLQRDQWRLPSALISLLPHLTKQQREMILDEVLTAARAIWFVPVRASALVALMPYLSKNEQEKALRDVLQTSSLVRGVSAQASLLVSLLPYLPDSDRSEMIDKGLKIVQVIDDESYRAKVLVSLVPFLSINLLAETLAAVKGIEDVDDRAAALYTIIPHLPADLQKEAFSARVLLDETDHAGVLAVLAPYLPNTLLDDALDAAWKIEDPYGRVYALCALTPRLLKEQQKKVRVEVLAVIDTIENEYERVLASIALAPHLSKDKNNKVLEEAFSAIYTIPSDYSRAQALVALIPNLPTELLEEALKIAHRFEDESYSVSVLVLLAQRLINPEKDKVLAEALAAIRVIESEKDQASALASLVPHLPTKLLAEALVDARTIKSKFYRATALIAIALYLPKREQEAVVGEALAVANALEREQSRAAALVALGPDLAIWASQKPEQSYFVFSEILSFLAARPRPEFLNDLAALMPFILSLAGDEGPQAAKGIYHAIQEVCEWWP